MMTDEEIIAVINRTISIEFEIDEKAMTPQAHLFEDLGLDSLDIVDLVVVLEQAFKFKIREEQSIRKIRTLGDIHRFVICKKAEIFHNQQTPSIENKGIASEPCKGVTE
jgi:acyl carrier protein